MKRVQAFRPHVDGKLAGAATKARATSENISGDQTAGVPASKLSAFRGLSPEQQAEIDAKLSAMDALRRGGSLGPRQKPTAAISETPASAPTWWQRSFTIPGLKRRDARLQAEYGELDRKYTSAQFEAARLNGVVPDRLVIGRSSTLDVFRVAFLGPEQERLEGTMKRLATQIKNVRIERERVREALHRLSS